MNCRQSFFFGEKMKPLKPLTLVVCVTLIAVSIISTCGCTLLSAPGSTAPLSSAYIQYQQNLSAGTVVTKTRDGHSLGHVPPPIDLIKPVPTQAAPLLQAV
jgi:hypothetical protein